MTTERTICLHLIAFVAVNLDAAAHAFTHGNPFFFYWFLAFFNGLMVNRLIGLYYRCKREIDAGLASGEFRPLDECATCGKKLRKVGRGLFACDTCGTSFRRL